MRRENEMVAVLVDRDGDILTRNEWIFHSNDGFARVEAAAEKLAAAGTVCAISWSRTNDGTTGYWGPSGARFRPYWYGEKVHA